MPPDATAAADTSAAFFVPVTFFPRASAEAVSTQGAMETAAPGPTGFGLRYGLPHCVSWSHEQLVAHTLDEKRVG